MAGDLLSVQYREEKSKLRMQAPLPTCSVFLMALASITFVESAQFDPGSCFCVVVAYLGELHALRGDSTDARSSAIDSLERDFLPVYLLRLLQGNHSLQGILPDHACAIICMIWIHMAGVCECAN